MKRVCQFILLIALFSCSNEVSHEKKVIEHDEHANVVIDSTFDKKVLNTIEISFEGQQKQGSLKQIIQKGRKEYKLLSEVKLSNSFKTKDFAKVEVFELNGRGNYGAASVFQFRTGNYCEIDLNDANELLKLLNNKKSYGNSIAACFDPRIGLVFYDKLNNPIKYVSICLACNYLKAVPTLEYRDYVQRGFSLKTRKQLHKLLQKWGFPDENYSELFDDEELFIDYLKTRGLSGQEIEVELSLYKEL